MNILDLVQLILLLAGALVFLFAFLGYGVRDKLLPLGLLLWIVVPLLDKINTLA